MNIFKAIKVEKKNTKRFYRFMILIAIILPLSAYLTSKTTTFYLVFLAIIEFLIMAAIINKINNTKISYSCANNRFKFKIGLLSKESLIFCDKVVMVHTEKMDEDMEIVIVTSVNFKNKNLKPALKVFLKRYQAAGEELLKLKSTNPETIFYYQVIRKGGLEKYLLLDCIYKNCVKAVYTDDCIQNIKIARGQTLV